MFRISLFPKRQGVRFSVKFRVGSFDPALQQGDQSLAAQDLLQRTFRSISGLRYGFIASSRERLRLKQHRIVLYGFAALQSRQDGHLPSISKFVYCLAHTDTDRGIQRRARTIPQCPNLFRVDTFWSMLFSASSITFTKMFQNCAFRRCRYKCVLVFALSFTA